MNFAANVNTSSITVLKSWVCQQGWLDLKRAACKNIGSYQAHAGSENFNQIEKWEKVSFKF